MPETQTPGEVPTAANQDVMSRLEGILSRAHGILGGPGPGQGLVSGGVVSPARPGGPPPQLAAAPPVPIPSVPGMTPNVGQRAPMPAGQTAGYEAMPTEFSSPEERRGAIVQGAMRSMAQFTSKLSQERMQKKQAEAKALTTAILQNPELAKELASKGGVAGDISKIMNARNAGDLEALEKLSGTSVYRGVQEAINEVTARKQTEEDRRMAAEKHASELDLRQKQGAAEVERAKSEAAQAIHAAQAGPETVDVLDASGNLVKIGRDQVTGAYDITKPIGGAVPPPKSEEALERTSWKARPGNEGKTDADWFDYKQSLTSGKSAESLLLDAAAKELGPGKTREDLTRPQIVKAIEPLNQMKSDISEARMIDLMAERTKYQAIPVWKPGAKSPVIVSKADALANNWPQVSAAVGQRVLQQEAGFGLVNDRIKAIKSNISAWDEPGFDVALVATLDASEKAYQNYLKGKIFGSLSPKAQNLIAELRNFRDDIGTLRGQLGTMSQRTQKQFEVYMAQIPGPTTSNSATAIRQLDAFQMTVDHLKKGLLDLGQDDVDLGTPGGAGRSKLDDALDKAFGKSK